MTRPPESGEQDPTLGRGLTRDKSIAWWLAGLLSGPVLVLVALLASVLPSATEALYGQRIGPFIGWVLARATGWLPLSIAEWVLLFLVFHWVGRWVTASHHMDVQGKLRLKAL